MALLEKMRKRMGWFITIIIALALLAFIVDADTLQSVTRMFSSKYDVGKIGGKSISAQEYQKQIEHFTKIYEITTGNLSTNEEASEMINQSAWQDQIAKYVFLPACKNSKLSVGEDEMTDMNMGVDISPIMLNYFADANGNFAKDKYVEFVNNKSKNADLQLFWNYLQDYMHKDRLLTKYLTLLEKSSYVNALETKREISESNNAYDIEFVMTPIDFAADSTIVATDAEIKAKYNRVKDALFQQESREADLVAFEITPSESDVAKAQADINSEFPEFLKQETLIDLKNFLYKYSDYTYEEEYFKKGDLENISPALDEFVANSPIGAIMEPQQNGNNFVGAKIINRAMVPDSIFVKYLPAGNVEKVADSLINVLKGGANFTNVAISSFAQEYLQQLQPGQIPGEIGWITKEAITSSSLPKEFKNLFTAKVNEPIKLSVSGNYIVALVSKTSKPIQKGQAAIFLKNAQPSQETYSQIYQEANTFVEKSGGKLENFVKEANEKGYDIIPVSGITGNQKNLQGYNNMREVTRWIYDNPEGKVSTVFSVDNKYFFVAAVTKINPQGAAPISQVSNYIKNQIESEKKVDKLAKEAKEAFGNDLVSLEEVAEKYNTTVSTQNGVTFSSMKSYGQLDPKFIGAICAEGEKGETNKIVGPVKGDLGIYYFKIVGKETGAYFSESDAKTKHSQVANALMRILPELMLQDSKTQDNRYKFY